jgi:hypothetical protein
MKVKKLEVLEMETRKSSASKHWMAAEKLVNEVSSRPAHPDTLTSIANLAGSYWNRGQCAEAEKLEVCRCK